MNFRPSLFIGVGGVGKNILLRLRRMIVENYRGLDRLPSIRFLHVDADANPGPDAGSTLNTEVLGQSLLFADAERCNLAPRIVRELAQGRDTIKKHQAVREWFDPALALDNNFTEGAGGVRQYGRLAFHYSADLFRGRVAQILNGLANQNGIQKTSDILGMPAEGNEPVIYVVCSLLGGTGSGTFLEVCYNSRAAARNAGINGAKMAGVFVISGNVDSRRRGNAYSALMELDHHASAALKGTKDHFSVSYPAPNTSPVNDSEPPVDICYLVSHAGEGFLMERNGLEEAVALNLFLEFGSGIAAEKRSRRVDITSLPDWRLSDDKGYPRQYMGFGITTLEFPAPRVQDMWTHTLAATALRGWLFESRKEAPDLDQKRREIEGILDENSLVTKLLTHDNKHLSFRVQNRLKDQQENVRKIYSAKQLDADLVVTTARTNANINISDLTFSMDPKECGVLAQDISNKAFDLQRAIAETIRTTVHGLVENQYQGPAPAKKYLTSLFSFVSQRLETFEQQYASLQRSADRAQPGIYEAIEKLRANLHEDFAREHHNKRLHATFLSSYTALALKREAYRAGIAMLSEDRMEEGARVPSLRTVLQTMMEQLDDYTASLARMADSLEGTGRQIEGTILGTPIAEGIKLTTERLGQLYRDVVPAPADQALPLMRKVMNELGEKDREGTVTKPAQILDIVTRRQADLLRVLSLETAQACERVRKVSVASELVRRENLSAILSDRIRRSRPMLQAAGFGPGENEERTWLGTAPREGDLEAVCQGIFAIHDYNGMRDRHLQSLPDPYRIIFASEKGNFPLRRLTILEDYRKDYRLMPRNHTDLRIAYRDILGNEEEEKIKVRAEAAALLGRLFAFLVEREDPKDQYRKVFLQRYNVTSRASEYQIVADGWQEAESALFGQQKDKEIERKTAGETILEKLEILIAQKGKEPVRKPDKERLWSELQKHLDALKSELEGGDINPEFQRQMGVIEKFRGDYGLKPPVGAPAHPSPQPAPEAKPEPTACGAGSGTDPQQPTPNPAGTDHAAERMKQDFREYVQKRLAAGAHDKDRLVKWGIMLRGLPREVALAIYEEESARGADVDIGKRIQDYRELFELVVEDGEIEHGERQRLTQEQQKLQLSDDQVREIEQTWTTVHYREFFDLAQEDGRLERHEREQLLRMKQILNLSDDQVRAIEADFVFDEERG